AALWEGPRLSTLGDHTSSLTPVLRQTLAALVLGDSEKQAAARLQVTINTLHDRVKRLHRILGAHSRSELIRTAAPIAGYRPRLQVELGRPDRVQWYTLDGST